MPEKVYTPTVIGVVERAERLGNNVVLVTLDDERDLRIDLGNATAVANYPDPAPDYLLFYGEDADGPWYLAIAGSPACYQIAARAIDHGAFLVFNFGLRVPKADDFDPGSVTGRRFDNPQAGFCLNADGEATEYLS